MGPAHPPTLCGSPGNNPWDGAGIITAFGATGVRPRSSSCWASGPAADCLRDQQAKLALITGRADMPHNPPPPGHGLSDLNRRRTRGGPHPTNPRHRRIPTEPTSALATHSTTTSLQVTALPPSEMARCDPTQVGG